MQEVNLDGPAAPSGRDAIPAGLLGLVELGIGPGDEAAGGLAGLELGDAEGGGDPLVLGAPGFCQNWPSSWALIWPASLAAFSSVVAGRTRANSSPP